MFSGRLVSHFLVTQILISCAGYIHIFRCYDTFAEFTWISNFDVWYRDLNKKTEVGKKAVKTQINASNMAESLWA